MHSVHRSLLGYWKVESFSSGTFRAHRSSGYLLVKHQSKLLMGDAGFG